MLPGANCFYCLLGSRLVSHFGFPGGHFVSLHFCGSSGFVSTGSFAGGYFVGLHFLRVSFCFHFCSWSSSHWLRSRSSRRCRRGRRSNNGRCSRLDGRCSGLGKRADSEETSNQGGKNFVHLYFLGVTLV